MRFFNFFLLNKQISDLNGYSLIKGITINQIKDRTKILVIDDQRFPFMEVLESQGFRITYKEDILNFSELENFQIILCDVNGVGKFLRSKFGGAFLVREAKEHYPDKIMILYTANSIKTEGEPYFRIADKVIAKGTSIEDWTTLLTDCLKKIVDPIEIWNKIAKSLHEEKVATREIAYLETKYVNAVQNGSYESLQKLTQKSSKHYDLAFSKSIKLLLEVIQQYGDI